MKKIVIVAGDTSGDLYGGHLAKKIKEKSQDYSIYSFGGKNLADNSTQLLDLVSGSVCGLIEVITSLKKIKKLFNETLSLIEKIKPNLIILIDFPDFNLRLAKKINNKYPVFYYVSPQLWAWRKKRIKIIKKYTAKIIPIFEFEVDFYKKRKTETLYFGHPLLEIINQEKTERKNLISFLPGSRKNEIKHHLKLLAKTKKIIKEKLPGYNFQVLKPEKLDKKIYKKIFPEKEIFNYSYQNLAKSKFVVSASGTATIETDILGIPHLIIYKVNKLTWHILQKVINTKYAGMLNILAQKPLVPELLQNKATPQKMAEIVLFYLKNEKKYNFFEENLDEAKKLLDPPDGISEFADYTIKYLKEKSCDN